MGLLEGQTLTEEFYDFSVDAFRQKSRKCTCCLLKFRIVRLRIARIDKPTLTEIQPEGATAFVVGNRVVN